MGNNLNIERKVVSKAQPKVATAMAPESRSAQLEELIRNNPNAKADHKAAWITELEGLRYEENYRPLNQKLMGELDTSPLLDAANAETKALRENGFNDPSQLARLKRQAGRRGLGLTTGQVAASQRLNRFGNSLNVAKTLDDARLAEQDRKDNLRGEMINLGRGIATGGTSALLDAAKNETARNNTNKQLDAQNDAAKKSGGASLVGAGIGAVFGGPVGMAIGAGLGGAIGSIF